jgi:cystathionine beta-lyase
MTTYFDVKIDRFDTHCMKWEFEKNNGLFLQTDRAHPKYGDEQLLPLWVADMDFKGPTAVIEALENRARHGIFGYCKPDDGFYEAVVDWMARRYGRSVERDWILHTPGVVNALAQMVQAYTAPGDKVLIQPPVYYPFYHVIENNGRVVARNPLKRNGTHYEMDFADLAQAAADPAVKMAFLCSPHNPVGRVWEAWELERFGHICMDNDVLVIADEIHCDLILNGRTFTSYATINEEFAARSIVCTAPSKTFNLAGLQLSNIIIPDAAMRGRMQEIMTRNSISGPNAFGIVANEAAYRHGEPWLAALLAYIEGNFNFLRSYIAEHIPQLKVTPLEGTYLAWVDFGALGLTPVERNKLLMEEAKVWLNSGELFGPEGADFERINIACPRATLEQALERIARVI